jgi:ribosomal RNA-processing protein 1
MSDKPLIQQDFADKLCSIIHGLQRPVAFQYLNALWKTLQRDWYQIDGIRLNKYYMFLRKLHQNTFMWLAKADWNIDDIKDIQKILKSGPLRYWYSY